MADFDRESMLEMFIYEMSQLLEQLEQIIILGESGFETEQINEIFRIMHTIKGSAAMMLYDNISTTAHSMEDLFFYIRDEDPVSVDYSKLTDIILEGMDFIKVEIGKIESGEQSDGDGSFIIDKIKDFLSELKGETKTEQLKEEEKIKISSDGSDKHKYKARIFFDDNCEMENIRAFTLVHNIKNSVSEISHSPSELIDESSIDIIKENGFLVEFSSYLKFEEAKEMLDKTIFLKDLNLQEILPGNSENKKIENNYFEALVRYDKEAEMENIRAYTLIHNMTPEFESLDYEPRELLEEGSLEEIQKEGLKLFIKTEKNYEEVYKLLSTTIYLKELVLKDKTKEIKSVSEEADKKIIPLKEKDLEEKSIAEKKPLKEVQKNNNQNQAKKSQTQHMISVTINKLDQLLNLMGELVIAEAMVTQNPELEALELDSFNKEARQLRKIINDVQDIVMSMRMIPLSTTFYKMHRIVRDMCKSLNKDVHLEIAGEETEVDKNIIEHISDPLMHIIRNSIDHGIEIPEEREKKGKDKQGTIRLEAKNSGGDVLIIIKDDGAGINQKKVLEKAKANGLLRKPEEEYTEKEICQLIFLPGFSTNEVVTGYSGRGVGMDVVVNNLESVGGAVLVDSEEGEGSIFTLKIPLTLAIIEGMTIKVGNSKYTIPIISIKQSFKASHKNIFIDPSGNEMITVRGECYNVVRLNEFFGIENGISDVEEGIMIMLENGEQTICMLADELIGEQQVVVKSIPKYIKKVRGISGCTLLGNGDISLIIDTAGFFDK